MIGPLRVDPGKKARLAQRDTRDKLGLDGKDAAHERLAEIHQRLAVLQARLYGEAKRSVLLILQGLDASGKDGVIRTVFTGLSPQGCRVASFKAPTSAELAHHYLWRVSAALPARGEIGIFNRSHYEDAVTVGVMGLAPRKVWSRRPGHIREWERMLTDEGTTLIKVFLNVSKEEQRQRLQERIDDPEKRWKFNPADLEARAKFDDFMAAYERVISETSTEWAPWYVVPADRNWVKSLAVAELLLHTLERLDPRLPEPMDEIVGVTIE
jgi:PPK2 family polyphosphate:nucleotide phosphotransferase